MLTPSLAASSLARHAMSLAAVVVVGLVLGVPFPAGLRAFAASGPSTAWAFAVNGFSTIAAATIGPMIALEIGHSALLFIAGAAYAVAFVVLARTDRSKPSSAPLAI